MSESTRFDYSEFDKLLDPKGPVMIAAQQFLKAAAISNDDIVFPPSYANPSEKKDDPPVYNIDVLDPGNASKNVCVLDSVPSQANRMEPLFGLPEYSALVPQYSVKLTEDSPPVSLLHVGHRLADAVFRGTTLRNQIVQAFNNYAKGDAAPLAKLGATSLVFGVWDSRGTGVKVPRLINSIVRAFNVTQLKRSAQYSPPIKYEQEGLIPPGLEGKPADHGLADVPSTHQIGGVQVHGEIRRDFSLNVELLRRLAAPLTEEQKKAIRTRIETEHSAKPQEQREEAIKKQTDEEQRNENLKLQRYILALALLAYTATQESTLRQGCQLLPKGKASWKKFTANGDEHIWNPESFDIPKFAVAAASEFGVVQPLNQPLAFDKTLLKTSIEADAKKKAEKKGQNAGAPIENLKRLVSELEPLKGDKFSMAKTAKLTKLQEAASAIEGDPGATEDLKALVARLKPLLIADPGAGARKDQMLGLFSAAAEQPTNAPDGATAEDDEEAPK
jgi:CRISPR-associated protein Csb1